MYLSSYKADVFDTLQSLQQQLKNCRNSNLWKTNEIRFGDSQRLIKHWLEKAVSQVNYLVNYKWPDRTGIVSLSSIASNLYLLWQQVARLLEDGCYVNHVREMYEQAVSLLPMGYALQLPLLDSNTVMQARWEMPIFPCIMGCLRHLASWAHPRRGHNNPGWQQLSLDLSQIHREKENEDRFTPLALTLRQARKVAGVLGVRQKAAGKDLSLQALRQAIAEKIATAANAASIRQAFAAAGLEDC